MTVEVIFHWIHAEKKNDDIPPSPTSSRPAATANNIDSNNNSINIMMMSSGTSNFYGDGGEGSGVAGVGGQNRYKITPSMTATSSSTLPSKSLKSKSSLLSSPAGRFFRRQIAPTLRALCIMCAVLYSMNGMQTFRSSSDSFPTTTTTTLSSPSSSSSSSLDMRIRDRQMLRQTGAAVVETITFETDADAAQKGFLNTKVANLIMKITRTGTSKTVREKLLEDLADAIDASTHTHDRKKKSIHTKKTDYGNGTDKKQNDGVVKEARENNIKAQIDDTKQQQNHMEEKNKDAAADELSSEQKDKPATPTISATSNMTTAANNKYTLHSTAEFVKHPGVVIATKVHGPDGNSGPFGMLNQSLCLLHHAYNKRVLYDIVVFTTEPIPEDQIQGLRSLIEPAKLTVVVDNDGIQSEIERLPAHKHDFLLERCNVTNSSGLTWWSTCQGVEKHHQERLAYNWQAEFRSLRVWNHPAMAEYRYMLWFDADSFCTKPWERDPVAFAIDKQAVILFDHFPQGHSKNWIQKRFFTAFGEKLCKIWITEEGHFGTMTKSNGHCGQFGIPNIHGFFHITDMDFYRSPKVQKAIDILFEHCFLCRFPDDQLTVTAPAAMLAPNRSYEMRKTMGTNLDVFHNHKLDGIEQTTPAGFKPYWSQYASKTLPAADGVCPIISGS